MLPRHPKAKHLLESGLFNDLSRFAELESRIQTLPEPEDRQAAFALFAEGLLTVRSVHRAVEVWHCGDQPLPIDARRRFSLPESLPGADGLFRSLEGEIHPFQLLLRPDREKPAAQEGDRFPPLIAASRHPLLITNCDALPNSWKKLKDFHVIRGVDLDRLETRTFQQIRRWLQGAGAAVERTLVSPYHIATLEKIQSLLNAHEQAALPLPPGSEPELLALRLIQRQGGRRVVLVLFSALEQLLLAIRQWRAHAGWGDLALLQVGDEQPPGGGALSQAELDFPLTTHPDGVRRFLAWHHAGTRVILATRAAAPLLARALPGSPQPDLALVFDTPEMSLPAARRLQLLTTPRQPSSLPATTTTHTAEPLALPRPWQVLLMPVATDHRPTETPWSVIPTLLDWVTRQETLRHTHLHLPESAPRPGGDEENQPLTFCHLGTEQARKWTERDRCLTRFRRARRGVLIHGQPMAPWLRGTPGDLVILLAFPGADRLAEAMEPVLTPTPSGGPGLVLLPLYLSGGVPTGNELLWELLRGLKALDGSFAALLRTAMEQMGREGKSDPEPFFRRIRLLPGEFPHAPTLENDLFATCLKRLGDPWDQRFGELENHRRHHGDGAIPQQWPEAPELAEWAARLRRPGARESLTTEQRLRLENAGFVWNLEAHAWEQEFRRLERFMLRLGSGRIPEVVPEDPRLTEWVARQRHLKKKGRLEPERIRRLEGVRFVWDLEEAAWEDAFQLFMKFRRARGHGKIPSHFPDDPLLGKWAEKQRKEQAAGKLASERRERLDAEGFVWDLAAAAWDEMLEVLRRHRELHGHGKVPKEWPLNPTLAIWAEEQRRLKEKGVLAPDRVERLEALAFVWDLKKARWEEGFQAFLQFRERHGHGKVPDPFLESPLLDQWAREMRRAHRLGGIPPQQSGRLEEVGFVWDLEMAAWEEMFAAWRRYQEAGGDAVVADPCPDAPLLPAWVQGQRRAWTRGTLTPELFQRLDATGFVWDPVEKQWNDMYHALTLFHHARGHFNVPKEWPEAPELFNWVKAQRAAREKERLDETRLARLVALGFVWDPQEAVWEEMFLALSAFHQSRNHCLVPAQWPVNPILARWVEQQRKEYRAKTLRTDRIARLEGLGFIWDAKAIFWEEMFAALTEYRERYGDCLVPEGHADNSQLAWWVATQRKARLSAQLEPERLQRLEAIGFVWDAQEVIWQESLRALAAFRQRFGHCVVPTDWPENPRLATWVAAQRNARLKGHLGRRREESLTGLGMVWDPKEAVAEEMMLQLADFKARHGHCDVPLETPEFPRLGMWLQFQRQSRKDGTLDPTRTRRLEELGVTWR